MNMDEEEAIQNANDLVDKIVMWSVVGISCMLVTIVWMYLRYF